MNLAALQRAALLDNISVEVTRVPAARQRRRVGGLAWFAVGVAFGLGLSAGWRSGVHGAIAVVPAALFVMLIVTLNRVSTTSIAHR